MTTSLPLPERIDMATAADLQTALMGHAGADLTLEAAGTRQISTPAIQVLISAATTWRANGNVLTIEDPSPQMVEQLAFGGLTLDHISSPEPETPS